MAFFLFHLTWEAPAAKKNNMGEWLPSMPPRQRANNFFLICVLTHSSKIEVPSGGNNLKGKSTGDGTQSVGVRSLLREQVWTVRLVTQLS